MDSYFVKAFNKNELSLALKNDYTTEYEIYNKNQFDYLLGYLHDLNAQTILIEPEYINKDYLLDYTSYYALCKEQYPKFCKRIHFFANTFTKEQFEQILLQTPEENKTYWSENYLGYLVAKPIPYRVVGTTVLKTYPKEEEGYKREFFGTRKYHINLFGNKIKLKSLAFQEQDAVISACATSAIWSMLHKASCDNYAMLKTPNEITKEADVMGMAGERLFPNKGLSVLQIANAIQKSGLVNEIRSRKSALKPEGNALNNSEVKRIISAYAPIGIPVILILRVPIENGKYGNHAITISGYRNSAYVLPEKKDTTEPLWRSDSIDRIFAHDDNFGPFARVKFKNHLGVETDWTLKDKVHPQRDTEITDVIVPVYYKIRLSNEDVEAIIAGVDALLELIFKDKVKVPFSWDLKLMFGDQIKRETKERSDVSDAFKKEVLLTHFPKYVWKADCYLGDNLTFQLLFDATDVAQGMFGICGYFYEEMVRNELHEQLKANKGYNKVFIHKCHDQFLDFLIEESSKLVS